MNTPPPPCAGQWELFDSTDYFDHRRARQLCETCPMLAACAGLLQDARKTALNARNGPRGTWAGQLVGGEVASQHRLTAEEDMFTEEEARHAHATFARTPASQRGDLPDRIRVGERVYQRRSGRRGRERAA